MSHYVTSATDVTAPITSSIALSPYDTFSIGAGTADGIVLNGIVKVSGGFVIGKISTVSAHQSVVRRILSPDAHIDAVVHGASIQIVGTGNGNGQGTVPRGIPVVKGDAVTVPTSGGAEIAIVGDVESTPTSPYQTVLISLPVNLLLESVVIVSQPAASS
jgi:cell shape-determining protein MreC